MMRWLCLAIGLLSCQAELEQRDERREVTSLGANRALGDRDIDAIVEDQLLTPKPAFSLLEEMSKDRYMGGSAQERINVNTLSEQVKALLLQYVTERLGALEEFYFASEKGDKDLMHLGADLDSGLSFEVIKAIYTGSESEVLSTWAKTIAEAHPFEVMDFYNSYIEALTDEGFIFDLTITDLDKSLYTVQKLIAYDRASELGEKENLRSALTTLIDSMQKLKRALAAKEAYTGEPISGQIALFCQWLVFLELSQPKEPLPPGFQITTTQEKATMIVTQKGWRIDKTGTSELDEQSIGLALGPDPGQIARQRQVVKSQLFSRKLFQNAEFDSLEAIDAWEPEGIPKESLAAVKNYAKVDFARNKRAIELLKGQAKTLKDKAIDAFEADASRDQIDERVRINNRVTRLKETRKDSDKAFDEWREAKDKLNAFDRQYVYRGISQRSSSSSGTYEMADELDKTQKKEVEVNRQTKSALRSKKAAKQWLKDEKAGKFDDFTIPEEQRKKIKSNARDFWQKPWFKGTAIVILLIVAIMWLF